MLVQRKIKIVFIVQSNGTQTQIRNYLTNTVFPTWDTSLTTAFTGYPFFPATAVVKEPYVFPIPGIAGRFAVYPKYVIQVEVDNGDFISDETGPSAQQLDARNRFANFIEDAKVKTRDLIASLSAGTSVLQIYKQPADGGNTVVSTT